MKRLLMFALAMGAFAPNVVLPFTRIPATGTVIVEVLAVRSAPSTVAPDARGFYFVTRFPVDLGAASCGVTPTSWFVIPRFDPTGFENPEYRDYVALLMRGKGGAFVLYVEGCINEFPRVVGMNLM